MCRASWVFCIVSIKINKLQKEQKQDIEQGLGSDQLQPWAYVMSVFIKQIKCFCNVKRNPYEVRYCTVSRDRKPS